MAKKLDPKDVEIFLLENLDFFKEREALVTELKFGHPETQGASSLLERQIHKLRDEQKELMELLTNFMETATLNEDLFNKSKDLTLNILGTSSKEEMITIVENAFHKDFNVDSCQLSFYNNKDIENLENKIGLSLHKGAVHCGPYSKEKISMLPGPPTLYQSILTSQLIETMDISSLRLGVTGAASIPIQLIKDMKETLGFETVITAYGLTESTGVVTMCTHNDDYETIANTSGCAIADVEVKCVDQNNKVVPAGEPGEILVRGYNITQGYFNNPEATQEAIDTDGWLHTGDIGILDSNGYIKITDRSKDMFIVGGFNAYPAEIENILCDHPAISQAAVIGIEDERMGEVAKAFVLLKPNQDLDADSLLQWSKDNMANYKVPREVEFVRELPTNAAGKIMKYLLKDES